MPKRLLKGAWLAAACAGLLVLAACSKPGGDTSSSSAPDTSQAGAPHSGGVEAPAPSAAKTSPGAAPATASESEDADSGSEQSSDMLESPDGQPAMMSEDAFLAAYRALGGVQTLPSGVMYKVEKSGHGKSPTAADRVRVAYKGTLMDGTVFDETKAGETREFAVATLIPGWREALQHMKEGDQWEIVIPSDQAYGDKGAPGVPPGSPLIFNVTLDKVLPPA
jgi:FKBP-type peptidyl-prolyl cis-trans isomerase